ncbi:MAG: fasciclin domain-containing protein [Solirubrobacteraceae bacterium]
MKKLVATTLAGVALSATLVACGSSSSSSSTVASASPSAATAPARSNIVQTAVAAGEFKTLVSLVKHAGLVGALSGSGPLTVFAPTDAAFAAVPKATLAELGKDPAKLKAVLLYHVVRGDINAAQVTKLKAAKTLEGGSVPIHVSSGNVYVGDAQVTKTNVMTSNGVIHVINRVLIPAG